MKKTILGAVIMLSLLGACRQSPSAGIDQAKTKEVLDHHWEAFKGGDLEAVMADYTEESILITPGETFKGLDEIRGVFVGAFKTYPQDQSSLKLVKSVVEKDVAYIIWEADAPSFTLDMGSDTFIIRNGKIISQTYAGVTTPKE